MNTFASVFINLKIALLSCILPILCGIALMVMQSNVSSLRTPVKWFGRVCNCLSPVVIIVFFYYSLFAQSNLSAEWIAVLGFSLCYLAYLPCHVKQEDSFVKNIVVNSLSLFIHLFKWSFCVSLIAIYDLLRSTMQSFNWLEPAEASSFLFLLLVSIAIPAAATAAKHFAKTYLT